MPRDTRHLAPAKKSSLGAGILRNDLSVVIPVAGLGRRMKSHGSKSLLDLRGGLTILDYQLSTLWDNLPKAEVTLVLGFDGEKVKQHVRNMGYPVRLVWNHDYENTNVSRSVTIALESCITKSVLVIYGDLVFNSATLEGVTLGDKSKVFAAEEGQMSKDEVGLCSNGTVLANMAYDLPEKWGQILFLKEEDYRRFECLGRERRMRKRFSHEIVNVLLDEGVPFDVHRNPKSRLCEVDNIRSLEKARDIVFSR